MAQKKEVLAVNDDRYEITQLGAIEAYDLYNELIGAIGPKLREQLLPLMEKSDLSQTDVAFAILALKGSIPRELMRSMREAFARTSKVQLGGVFLELKESGIFDQHFAGRMHAIDLWMVACARVNFMSFLSEAAFSGRGPATASE